MVGRDPEDMDCDGSEADNVVMTAVLVYPSAAESYDGRDNDCAERRFKRSGSRWIHR